MSRVVARRRVAVVVAIANANSSEDGGGHGDDNLHDYLPHIDVNFAHDIYFLRLMFFLIGGAYRSYRSYRFFTFHFSLFLFFLQLQHLRYQRIRHVQVIQSPAVAPEHGGHEGAFASHGLVRQSVEGFGVVVDGHV